MTKACIHSSYFESYSSKLLMHGNTQKGFNPNLRILNTVVYYIDCGNPFLRGRRFGMLFFKKM